MSVAGITTRNVIGGRVAFQPQFLARVSFLCLVPSFQLLCTPFSGLLALVVKLRPRLLWTLRWRQWSGPKTGELRSTAKQALGLHASVEVHNVREMAKIISAWHEAKLQNDAVAKVDAVARAHGEPTSRFPQDWEAMMDIFRGKYEKGHSRVQVVSELLRSLQRTVQWQPPRNRDICTGGKAGGGARTEEARTCEAAPPFSGRELTASDLASLRVHHATRYRVIAHQIRHHVAHVAVGEHEAARDADLRRSVRVPHSRSS